MSSDLTDKLERAIMSYEMELQPCHGDSKIFTTDEGQVYVKVGPYDDNVRITPSDNEKYWYGPEDKEFKSIAEAYTFYNLQWIERDKKMAKETSSFLIKEYEETSFFSFLDIDMSMLEVLFGQNCLYEHGCSREDTIMFEETGRVGHNKVLDNYFKKEIDYYNVPFTLHYRRTIKKILNKSSHIHVGTYSMGSKGTKTTIEKRDTVLMDLDTDNVTYKNFYTEIDFHKHDCWFNEMISLIQQKGRKEIHVFEDDVRTINGLIENFNMQFSENDFLKENEAKIIIHLNKDYEHMKIFGAHDKNIDNIRFFFS